LTARFRVEQHTQTADENVEEFSVAAAAVLRDALARTVLVDTRADALQGTLI
jgi:hypothetical protein